MKTKGKQNTTKRLKEVEEYMKKAKFLKAVGRVRRKQGVFP